MLTPSSFRDRRESAGGVQHRENGVLPFGKTRGAHERRNRGICEKAETHTSGKVTNGGGELNTLPGRPAHGLLLRKASDGVRNCRFYEALGVKHGVLSRGANATVLKNFRRDIVSYQVRPEISKGNTAPKCC